MSSAPRPRSIRTFAIVAGVAISAVLAALLVPMAASAAPAPISGTVHGPDGKPLAGVVIKAVDVFNDGEVTVSGTTTSSSSGAFAFGTLSDSSSTLWFGATSKTYAQYLGQTSVGADAEFLGSAADKQVYVQATLAAAGTLSGKVTRLPSGNLAGYTVRAYSQKDANGPWTIAGAAKTSSTGVYSMTGLEPGGYRLETIDLTSAHPLYAPSFSGGATDLASASTVGILAGKVSAYNFALGKAGTIFGTVTGIWNSVVENVPGVRVTVYRLTGGPLVFTAATALDSPGTVTSSNGTYTISGLAPGYYTLQFTPPATGPLPPSGTHYGQEFLGHTDDPTTAAPIHIANGTVSTGANIQLSLGGSITGIVSDVADSAPLQNMRVSADYVGRDQDDPAEHAKSVLTESDGSYSISGLGPGTYDLWVGSHADTDPNSNHENQGYIRQVVTVPPMLSTILTVNVQMTTLGAGLQNTVSPHITQASAVVGDTLTMDPGTWSAPDATFTYEWLRSSSQSVIRGATGSTYTLQPADAGQYIYGFVTAHSFGYGRGTYPTSGGIVPGNGTMSDPSVAPTIGGVAAIGQTLTANPGTWPLSGTSFGFEWQYFNGSGWFDMDNGHGRTVVVDGDTFNPSDQVRVIVTGMKEGYFDHPVTAVDGDPVVSSPIQLVTAPTAKNTAAGFMIVGGVWNPAQSDSQTVDWTVVDPSGLSTPYNNLAILPSFEYTAADYITFTVTDHRDGWIDASTSTLTAQIGTKPIATGSAAVIGGTVAQVGVTLNAPSPSWLPAAGVSTFQWQYQSGSTWKNITTGTAAAYTPVASDVGRVLRVVTTRKDVGFATATLISTATVKVALASAPMVTTSTYSGTLGTGDTVTEGLVWSPTPTTRTFQWEYSATSGGTYTKIAKATGPSYVIPVSLEGKFLEVVETASLAGHAASTPFALHINTQIQPDKIALVKAPTITHVGNQYSAIGATFSPSTPAGAVEYHWSYYDENDAVLTDASGAAGPTYNVSGNPSAHWVLRMVIPTTPIGYSYSSATPVPVKLGAIVPSGAITLPASAVGQAIVPSTITWLVQNPTLKYQWQYEVGTTWHSIAASAGGTAATFTPSATYFAKHLRVITTASRANYTTASVTSGITTPAVGAAPTAGTGPSAPGINGYGVGSTWTAVPGTWSVSAPAFHYAWAFGATPTGPWTTITGATGATYSAPDDLYHQYLQLTITASKTGYSTGSTQVVSSQLQQGQLVTKVLPKVTLTAGSYTVANPGTWQPAATSYSFDWELFDPATDSSTQESTSPTYSPLVADAGKEITLTVYPNRLNYNGGLGATIIVRPGSAIAPTSSLTLTGAPVINGTLTVGIPGWNTVNPFVQVTWYRNGAATGTNINSLTYAPVAADLGKVISAKVTASKDGYPTYGTTLASSGPTISDVVLTATVDPVISGTPQVTHVVTASTGAWNVTGLAFAYQWYRGGVAIPGATASSYLLSGPDYATELTVRVTASKAFFTTASDLSQAVTVDTGAQVENSGANPLTITGQHTLNSVLTVSVKGVWNTPVTVTLQWLVSHNGGVSWNNVNGQGGTTFALTAANNVSSGDEVEAYITAQAPGFLEYENASAVIAVP